MEVLFHILMELIFRPEWPSPIIVPFSTKNRHCIRGERRELEVKVNMSARNVGAVFSDKAVLSHSFCSASLAFHVFYLPNSYCLKLL